MSPVQALDRIRGAVPPVYSWTGLLGALTATAGEEADAARALITDLGDQRFVATADWALTLWEQEMGVPVQPGLPVAQRRARLQAQLCGELMPSGLLLQQTVRALCAQSSAPDLLVTAGLWVIYKLEDAGWPGDQPLVDTEARLAVMGPAHLGHWVAPWDLCLGLTVHELDLLHWHAIDELTVAEMDGGHCPPTVCAPELLLDAIDAAPLDQVDLVTQDLYEFCADDPPGWVLERFSLRTRLGLLTMEQVDAIDLAELVAPLLPDYLLDEVHAMPLDVTDPTALDRLEP